MHFLGSLLSHAMCCLSSRKYSTPPVTADTLCPRGISTECFEKLVSSIPKGAKMEILVLGLSHHLMTTPSKLSLNHISTSQ